MPYIHMNQPWVYMCSPSCPSLPIPLLLNKSHQGLYALLRYILHYCNKYIVLMRNLCANIVLACYLLLPPNEWSRLAQWGHLKWGNGVMLLLLLSRFSRVRLCATPQTAAHQAPLSLGFSRQEHWSGLPFPPPCMKVKSEREVTQSCPTLRDPMNCSPPGSLVHWTFQARVLEWVAIAFSEWGYSWMTFMLIIPTL